MKIEESGNFESITKSKKLIEKEDFVSKDIEFKFNGTMMKYVSDVYVCKSNNKIISFCLLMKEELECGFLHYHIPSEHRDYFSKKYPNINQKTNQVLYIYTANDFRKKGVASRILEFIVNDLKKRDYKFLWLIKETSSYIYDKMDFVNFLDILSVLKIDEDEFLNDYQKICGYSRERLLNFYGNRRLVKVL